ncbi:putative endo-1,3(4)-beta-glucanase [Sphaerosporella brunnea]|uniref:endo-1,3(4)-beta-glucanase n=1 Tax=Sphaerosporella brunnea TaxID=1250544 RepID=A0A5J5EYK6_9PEZI|nr:putative endo-1,3(4)-beta-glucanase [Sphaerosporella brunnea]
MARRNARHARHVHVPAGSTWGNNGTLPGNHTHTLLGEQSISIQTVYSNLVASYSGASFFDGFDFFTGSDPTNGFVKYIDQATAQSQGMISTSGSSVYFGVDNKNVAPNGRQSIRLESKQRFTRGLFILDAAHIPGDVCGSWPAFWTVGDNWPNQGEIDIIEGVNLQTSNNVALHTSDGCTITGTGASGTLGTTNCYVYAPGQSNNAGCGFRDNSNASYGDGFNANGGGVYAMEWTSDYINVWWFPRSQIPADVLGSNPNPSGWGTPSAAFQGNCNIDDHFTNHKVVFDITFCGDWAGGVWGSSGCQSRASSCNDFVANNPQAMTESNWQINSLRVFSS